MVTGGMPLEDTLLPEEPPVAAARPVCKPDEFASTALTPPLNVGVDNEYPCAVMELEQPDMEASIEPAAKALFMALGHNP